MMQEATGHSSAIVSDFTYIGSVVNKIRCSKNYLHGETYFSTYGKRFLYV